MKKLTVDLFNEHIGYYEEDGKFDDTIILYGIIQELYQIYLKDSITYRRNTVLLDPIQENVASWYTCRELWKAGAEEECKKYLLVLLNGIVCLKWYILHRGILKDVIRDIIKQHKLELIFQVECREELESILTKDILNLAYYLVEVCEKELLEHEQLRDDHIIPLSIYLNEDQQLALDFTTLKMIKEDNQ